MVPEPITATRVMPESALDSLETGVRESATTVGTFGSAQLGFEQHATFATVLF